MKRSIKLREAGAGLSLRSVGNDSDEEDVPEPRFLRGHRCVNGMGKVHKTCVVCKKTRYTKCICGDGVCGTRKKNKDCMVVHLETVMLKEIGEERDSSTKSRRRTL
jgi:hypothetical protein